MAGHHTNPERFLDQAVVQVGRAIEIHHVKILRYRRATADLLMVAGTGWKEGVVRSATFASDLKSPPGWSFQTGEPLCIEDFDQAPEFAISQTLKEHDIVSLANVPILTDGAAWGVLEVDSTVHRDFTQDSVQFMVAAAAIIGSLLRDDTSSRGEAAALAEAAAQAQHREILLRELQHRVKNNFQLILASIGLQKRRFPEGETHRALDHITNRINAISLAHDQLAPRQDMQAVDVARYLRALCASIEQQVEDVALDIEADEVELSIDRAVPLGLILNEAATNSCGGQRRPHHHQAEGRHRLRRGPPHRLRQRPRHPEEEPDRLRPQTHRVPRPPDRRPGRDRKLVLRHDDDGDVPDHQLMGVGGVASPYDRKVSATPDGGGWAEQRRERAKSAGIPFRSDPLVLEGHLYLHRVNALDR